MPQDLEIWKPIVGFEGFYEISSHGRLRRIAGGQGTKGLRILNPYLMKIGYRSTQLSKGKGAAKTRKPYYIHALVAEAFIGPRPIGMSINHKDGNKQNNHYMNLEYVTHCDNIRHAVSLDLHPRGERNGHAKLTDRDVMEIRDLRGRFTTRELGRLYGVCSPVISNIHTRKYWKHIS